MRLVLLHELVSVIFAYVIDCIVFLEISCTLFLFSLLRREEGREVREGRVEDDSLESRAVVCSCSEEVECATIESAVVSKIETAKIVIVIECIRQHCYVWMGERREEREEEEEEREEREVYE